jgi:heme oxygenase
MVAAARERGMGVDQSKPAVGSGRHAKLRAATHGVHAALDSFTIKSGYFENSSRFTDYLCGMAHFHHAYEQAIAGSDTHGWCALWRLDRHSGWIADELWTLGQSRAVSTSGPADPAALALAPLATPCTSGLLGSLYVLAGSTLGARMLHRLTVARSVPAASGSTYLAHAAASMNWQAFLAFLETADIDSEDRMIEGALATFAGVQRSLEIRA